MASLAGWFEAAGLKPFILVRFFPISTQFAVPLDGRVEGYLNEPEFGQSLVGRA